MTSISDEPIYKPPPSPPGLVARNYACRNGRRLALNNVESAALEGAIAGNIRIDNIDFRLVEIQTAADGYAVSKEIAVGYYYALGLHHRKSAPVADIRADPIVAVRIARIARISNSNRVIISHVALDKSKHRFIIAEHAGPVGRYQIGPPRLGPAAGLPKPSLTAHCAIEQIAADGAAPEIHSAHAAAIDS